MNLLEMFDGDQFDEITINPIDSFSNSDLTYDEVSSLDEAVQLLMPNFVGMEEYFRLKEATFASFCHSQLSGGIGMKIRNSFKLWDDSSALHVNLKKTHGLSHVDDMSNLILTEIHKKVRSI